MKRIAVISLALFTATACTSVESSDIKTSGIYADLWAVSDGEGTSYSEAILRVGGATSNTFVTLSEGDDLTATVAEVTENMTEQNIGEIYSYRADFSTADADVDYVIALERTEDESAPSSVMSLPLPFVMDPVGSEYSRDDDDIVLTWDNQQSEIMKIWIEGTCIHNQYHDNETDAGIYTISSDSLEPIDPEANANCEIEITLWRSRPGDVDSAYGEGGVAWGYQRRKITTLSTP